MDDKVIPVFHKRCDKVAFYFTRRLKRGEVLWSYDVRRLDGSIPTCNEQIICGRCGDPISITDIYQGDSWMDWFIVPDFEL